MAERNPNLISPKAMEAMASTAGAGRELISEIFTKINNAKDKPKKIEVLRKYETPGMRMILKGAFDPKIEWELPEGTPPYIENEAPAGTEHTYLEVEARRLYNFAKGVNNTINKIISHVNRRKMKGQQLYVNKFIENIIHSRVI